MAQKFTSEKKRPRWRGNSMNGWHIARETNQIDCICLTLVRWFFSLGVANNCFGMLIVSHLTLFGLVSGNINHNKNDMKRTLRFGAFFHAYEPTCHRYILLKSIAFPNSKFVSISFSAFSPFAATAATLFFFINSNPVWQHIKCDILVVKSVFVSFFLLFFFFFAFARNTMCRPFIWVEKIFEKRQT